MKSKLFLFVFLNVNFLTGQQIPSRLTLEEAVNFGLENNRAIVNANREVQKAYKEKWSTIAIGLPQVKATMDYQNFLQQPVSLIPAQFFGGNEGEFAEVTFGTKQNFIATAQISQLLFDGSYLVGLQAIEVYSYITENILEKTKLDIRKDIINTYSAVLLARESTSILEKNSIALAANLAEVKQLYANGFAEEENVEQLRLTLAQMETQKRYAENLEKITLNMLKLLLGYPSDRNLILDDTLETITAPDLFDMNLENADKDLSNNIDIRIASNSLNSERILLKLERSKALPKLNTFLTGTYTGNSNSFTFLERSQKWFGSSLFGVGLEIPIFSSLQRSANTQKARIAVEQAKTNLEQTQEQVALSFESAKNEYSLSVASYFTSVENLRLAESIQSKNQVKYFEGMATSFELRQSQLQLYTAQNDYLKSIQNVIAKKIALETLLNLPQ